MAERVNVDKIDKLKNQRIKKKDTVDSIDAVDRGFGRVFSKIGKYFAEDFWK